MRALADEAERGIGNHYSRPGRLDFEYEEARIIWDLTPAEIAEGLRIAEDDSDSGTSDLFLLE